MQQMNFDEIKTERMELAAERISQIAADSNVPVPFARFFKEEAQFITKMLEISEIIREKKFQHMMKMERRVLKMHMSMMSMEIRQEWSIIMMVSYSITRIGNMNMMKMEIY